MYIGIDLGGTNISAGLVDEQGSIVRKGSVPTLADRHYSEIIKDMAQLALKLVKDEGLPVEQIKAIGIGSPGTPDVKKGIIMYANNLRFNNVPMRMEMQKYMDLPVHVENDANCAALAEAVAGVCKGARHSVTITLGTGIGSGIIIDNKIYNGYGCGAGELGHMVICINGEQCTCGRLGCWEAYASATALIRQTKEAALKNPDSMINKLVANNIDKIEGKTAFDAARAGDAVAREVVDTYINYLAEGIVNVINIFKPEVVAIGGGISKQGEYLLAPLRSIVKKRVYDKHGPQTKIEAALLGNDAGIIGAAMLGREMGTEI
ncbi:MAG: ROK family protein [Clostridiaceae bacterium]|nr:ROK family protein [Clostridiaceae bacterium]